jgi:hypothetical protein
MSPITVKAVIKAHLFSQGHKGEAFVEVHMMPGTEDTVYVITTEAQVVSHVQALLESRLRRKCPYDSGSFIVFKTEINALAA